MSEMGFYSLPDGKLHKKNPKKSRLTNFPAGYVGSFYRNLADNIDSFIGSDFYGRIAKDSTYHQKMCRNTPLQLLTLPKVCKATSTIP